MSSSHFNNEEKAGKVIKALMAELDKKDANPKVVFISVMACFTSGENKSIKPEIENELMRQASMKDANDPGLTYDHIKKLDGILKANKDLVSQTKLSPQDLNKLVSLANDSIDAAIGRTKTKTKTSSRKIFHDILSKAKDGGQKKMTYKIDETDSNDLIDKRDSVSQTTSTSNSRMSESLDDMLKDMSEDLPTTPRKK